MSGDELVYVGNTALLEEHGISCELPSRSGAAIHVAIDGKYCGHILVADRIRSRAFDALESLRVQGIKKMVLLTGDVLSVARPLASKLNFDMLRAELKPEDKLSALAYLMSNKGSKSSVAFVGDGYNDRALMERVRRRYRNGGARFGGCIHVGGRARDGQRHQKAPEGNRNLKACLAYFSGKYRCRNMRKSRCRRARRSRYTSVTAAVIACFAVSAAVLINTLRLK